jgi:hypothetical protein
MECRSTGINKWRVEGFLHVPYELVYNLLKGNKLVSKIPFSRIDIFINLALLMTDGSDKKTRHITALSTKQ